MRDSKDKPQGHRLFAALYDRINAAAERGEMGDARSELLSEAVGAVLEIGGGTGANLPHYRDVERVVISEPDPFMRRKLEPKLEPKLDQVRVPVEVSDAGAESLPFADGSFDTVVSTLVLCSVPDQRAALEEIRRVLRPDGKLLFLEHVRGEGRIARWQDRLVPIWKRLFAGCHPNRDTVAAMEASGFRIEEFGEIDLSVPFSGIAPHVRGIAKVSVSA